MDSLGLVLNTNLCYYKWDFFLYPYTPDSNASYLYYWEFHDTFLDIWLLAQTCVYINNLYLIYKFYLINNNVDKILKIFEDKKKLKKRKKI